MDTNVNKGIIVKRLRTNKGLSVYDCATLCGRTKGWLSQIENGTGPSKLSSEEFEKIVEKLGGVKHRSQFKTWVANHRNASKIDRTFDGAVLKFMRLKKAIRLKELAKKLGLSTSHISRIETGSFPCSAEFRAGFLDACGYAASSFKNYSKDPKRSKAVPAKYKLEILINNLSDESLTKVFETSYSQFKAGELR